ncbi:GNAT family N-acetyltransferase [uncultured Jatrophihabitans sp.]|uniref:GNAT family N-acetyltransferase n=1 Tax=uncultured Jatrophihabitans sp. TaxID=1610747 RepID=UPI0035CC79B9
MTTGDDLHIRDAATAELDAATLYRILALRSAVFVVEQECAYLDPDGRDLEAGARQLWIELDGELLATLRMVTDPGGVLRIGRVATVVPARGAGLAARLMQRALELAGSAPTVLEAQAHLHDWYARFGFVRDGAEYLDDGIPHIPMRRSS